MPFLSYDFLDYSFIASGTTCFMAQLKDLSVEGLKCYWGPAFLYLWRVIPSQGTLVFGDYISKIPGPSPFCLLSAALSYLRSLVTLPVSPSSQLRVGQAGVVLVPLLLHTL